MSPEEEFDKWWGLGDPSIDRIVKEAWLEAYRAGMTRAAEIVQERGRGYPSSGTTPTDYRAIDPMITAQAILTERDKEGK